MPNASDNSTESTQAPPSHPAAISRVILVGAGWTGRQIAGQMVTHGICVRVVDPSQAALDATQSWIEQQLEPLHREGFWPSCTRKQLLERLELLTSNPTSESIANPGLVLECVPEQVALKRRILRSYAERYGSETILASNSSYFVPSTFSKHLVAPERFAHFHFHVPIWRAALIDIAAGPETSEATLGSLADLAQRIGQTPLIQRTENTGYVFNWMLKSLLQSALQLADRQVATPAQIDMAWKIATGMPTGPFGIMDQIGLDIIHHTMSHARFVEGDAAWERLLAQLHPLIDAGHLGVKTGKGFFDYGDPSHWRADAPPSALPPPPSPPPAR